MYVDIFYWMFISTSSSDQLSCCLRNCVPLWSYGARGLYWKMDRYSRHLSLFPQLQWRVGNLCCISQQLRVSPQENVGEVAQANTGHCRSPAISGVFRWSLQKYARSTAQVNAVKIIQVYNNPLQLTNTSVQMDTCEIRIFWNGLTLFADGQYMLWTSLIPGATLHAFRTWACTSRISLS